MGEKNFKIYSVQITGKWICESKYLKVDIFTLAPLNPLQAKLSTRFFSPPTQAERNDSIWRHFSENLFPSLPPPEGGGDYVNPKESLFSVSKHILSTVNHF